MVPVRRRLSIRQGALLRAIERSTGVGTGDLWARGCGYYRSRSSMLAALRALERRGLIHEDSSDPGGRDRIWLPGDG